MNRSLDSSPHAQGLTKVREIAVRQVVISELTHLGIIDRGSDRGKIAAHRAKELFEAGEVARLQAIQAEKAAALQSLAGADAAAKAAINRAGMSPPVRRTWRDRGRSALRRLVGRPR